MKIMVHKLHGFNRFTNCFFARKTHREIFYDFKTFAFQHLYLFAPLKKTNLQPKIENRTSFCNSHFYG